MPAETTALAPHEAPPNMANTFMTRYDYDYNKGDPPLRPLVADGAESGHSKNRPLFDRPAGEDWQSVSHKTFTGHRGVSLAHNLPEIAVAAGKSRILGTAHIRGMKSMAGVPWDEEPTVSTYKDHYPRKFTTAPNGGRYAGDATTKYKPWLLSIDSLDDDGVGKRKRPKGWRPEDELNRPTTTVACKRPQDNITVFGPNSGDGQPWRTEYGTYGDRSLDKPSLLPRGLGESTFAGDRSSSNKRQLLESLAGRRPKTTGGGAGDIYGSQFDTNPIPMNPMEREKCRVARRVPLEGPVNMTIYQSDFVKQTNKPELHDAPRDKAQGAPFVNSKVPPQPPKDMHASIVRELERRGLGEIKDRHLHKYKPWEGCGSPTDTMHSLSASGSRNSAGERQVVAGRRGTGGRPVDA